MYEQTELAPLISQWEAEGKWINRGTWQRASNGTIEYFPTPEEIAAKCALLRTIENWRGAHARAPRDGEHAVMTTRGL
jgi:hypothetical protein